MEQRGEVILIRILITIFIGILLLITGGYLYNKAQQFTAEWIHKSIKSREQDMNIHLQWSKLSVSFIPLKIEIQNAVMEVQEKAFYEPIKVDRLVISPDYISLLKGRFLIKAVLAKPHIKIKSDRFGKRGNRINSDSLKPSELLKDLKNFPGIYVHLQEASISIKTYTNPVFIDQLDAHIRFVDPSNISIYSKADILEIGDHPMFSFSLGLSVKKDLIAIKEFKIRNDRSWLDLAAAQGKESYWIKLETSVFSEDVDAFVYLWTPDLRSLYSGQVEFKGFLEIKAPL